MDDFRIMHDPAINVDSHNPLHPHHGASKIPTPARAGIEAMDMFDMRTKKWAIAPRTTAQAGHADNTKAPSRCGSQHGADAQAV